nr:laminin subunit gamma-3 [Anolis sagrei ordinatus]
MAALLLWPLLLLDLATAGSMDACFSAQGQAQRCLPSFENAAFEKRVRASHTCGSPPEDYCSQMGARGSGASCQRCDAGQPSLQHNATLLTDFHVPEEPSWWQSPTMAFGVQHPNSVTLTLHLGKAYEITYVRLKFHTSRPESFAIYKRNHIEGPWVPYQYYSASCQETYGKPTGVFLKPGQDERVAFCSDEFSDISPLSGGSVAFSTLEGRPSAYNFDQSLPLQEWVTATDLLVSLDRLNTFGDDIFQDPKVLRSYYYAISDFSVGGRCKCNGHASQCIPDEEGRLACLCQHNTTGTDCQMCLPFYQDRPWARATAASANECLPCNCSGRSEECVFDRELFRRTGRAGRCQNCWGNTDGPHCERCLPNYYRWDGQAACQPCNCNPAGSLNPQCDSSGACECKEGVTGWKCERCRDGFHSLGEGGCRPCTCDPAGSNGTCDPNTGRCPCKAKAEGYLCDRCQPGSFNLQLHNPSGCTSCFCYGHAAACTAAPGYEVHEIVSRFDQDLDGWSVETPEGNEVLLDCDGGERFLGKQGEGSLVFWAPEQFLGDRRLSYGQPLSLSFCFRGAMDESPLLSFQLVLEGNGANAKKVHQKSFRNGSFCEEQTFWLHEAMEELHPVLSTFQFQHLLSNLTALRIQMGSDHGLGRISLTEVRLVSARPGLSLPASWVEECLCPKGFVGQFCEACAPGFRREVPFGGPFAHCVPCSCNQHGRCDPDSGLCHCLDHTEGPSCEHCAPGFFGNPFRGRPDDCQPCPCPGQSPCAALPSSGELVCTRCPPGLRGRRCELCDDGFFGDPLGQNGPLRPCQPCQCNGNVDPNAVGNCDSHSGRCLRCLHNTTGEQCQRCKEGFYGDPLATDPAAKCSPCQCDARGSVHGPDVCDPVSGQCPCLASVTGRDCNRCRDEYFDLQPKTGCKRCQCHPLGSQHSRCDPFTGQCLCHPGVEGLSCDRCQAGTFGFSSQGCQACNCSQLGSLAIQCHEDGMCICKEGFVGLKCDQCATDFFLDPGSEHCQKCPLCYGLVKEEADKLKASLAAMESQLEKPNCELRVGFYSEMLREAPRGDSLQDQDFWKGTQAVFLEEIAAMERKAQEAQIRLRNVSAVVSCGGQNSAKACILLADVRSTLESTQREIRLATQTLAAMDFPLEVSHEPQNWTLHALESRDLSWRHMEAAALVEDTARKALLTSSGSHLLLQSVMEDNVTLEMEERYHLIQKAQKELGLNMEEATAEVKAKAASVHRINTEMGKNLSGISSLDLRPLLQEVEDLRQAAEKLQAMDALKMEHVVSGAMDMQKELQKELQRMQQVEELRQRANDACQLAASSLANGEAVVSKAKDLLSNMEGMKKLSRQHNKNQRITQMAARPNRTIADAQKKVRQTQRLLGDSATVSDKAQRSARDAEEVSKGNAKVDAGFAFLFPAFPALLQLAHETLLVAKQEQQKAGQIHSRFAATLEKVSKLEQEAKELDIRTEGPNQVAMEMDGLAQTLGEARLSLERDVADLNDLLASLGRGGPSDATLTTGWTKLQGLRLRLTSPGPLERKLTALQEEAKGQEQRMAALESDLEEIRDEKRSLEAILQSLPDGCVTRK